MQSGGPGSGGSAGSIPSIGPRGDSSSRNVPIYVLFLIMLSSGIFTLIFLWICVQYIYHRRLVRQALEDLERMFVAQRTWEADGARQTERENVARHDAGVPVASDLNPDVKRCDKNVELTYVVMAGCDHPTFLARPVNASEEPASSSRTAMYEVGGYLGQENKPVMNNNAQEDDSVLKGGNDGQRTGETSQETSKRSTDNGDTDIGVGGPKSGDGASSEDAGAYDRPSYVQSRFGLEGKTGSNRTEGSNLLLKETDSRSNAGIDPRASASDQMTAPGEGGWRPEDLTHTAHTQGVKDGLMDKIKEKMPGHHSAAAGESTDPKAASKKGVVQKIKEKLPGHHGNDAGM